MYSERLNSLIYSTLYSSRLILIGIPLVFSIFYFLSKKKFKEASKDDVSFEDGFDMIVDEVTGKPNLESESKLADPYAPIGVSDALKPNTNSTLLYSAIILFFMKHKIFLFFCSLFVVFLIIANLV